MVHTDLNMAQTLNIKGDSTSYVDESRKSYVDTGFVNNFHTHAPILK
jgi:hypothetical protein